MAERTIENDCLRVTVNDAGAELTSAYDKSRRAERIWWGDPAVWNRHAPILFPFVGKVVNGRYRVDGREYAMTTQHGFARDMDFVCAEETATAVKHVLTATDRTRAVYPYDFRLTVNHRLEGSALFVEWTVENIGSDAMFFSIGGHPGFMPPDGICKEDCSIVFPGQERLRYISANKAGYAVSERKTLILRDGRAPYQPDIPDTWIFEDNQVKAVGIAAPGERPFVMLRCERFPMLAVWANPNGPFICLEPWFGRTDDDGFTGNIDRKKAIQRLDGGEGKEIAYSIEFC